MAAIVRRIEAALHGLAISPELDPEVRDQFEIARGIAAEFALAAEAPDAVMDSNAVQHQMTLTVTKANEGLGQMTASERELFKHRWDVIRMGLQRVSEIRTGSEEYGVAVFNNLMPVSVEAGTEAPSAVSSGLPVSPSPRLENLDEWKGRIDNLVQALAELAVNVDDCGHLQHAGNVGAAIDLAARLQEAIGNAWEWGAPVTVQHLGECASKIRDLIANIDPGSRSAIDNAEAFAAIDKFVAEALQPAGVKDKAVPAAATAAAARVDSGTVSATTEAKLTPITVNQLWLLARPLAKLGVCIKTLLERCEANEDYGDLNDLVTAQEAYQQLQQLTLHAEQGAATLTLPTLKQAVGAVTNPLARVGERSYSPSNSHVFVRIAAAGLEILQCAGLRLSDRDRALIEMADKLFPTGPGVGVAIDTPPPLDLTSDAAVPMTLFQPIPEGHGIPAPSLKQLATSVALMVDNIDSIAKDFGITLESVGDLGNVLRLIHMTKQMIANADAANRSVPLDGFLANLRNIHGKIEALKSAGLLSQAKHQIPLAYIETAMEVSSKLARDSARPSN